MDRIEPPDFETQSYSLRDFVATAKGFSALDTNELETFTVNGIVDDDHYVVINPLLNAITGPHRMTASRDYDSLIGIHDDIIIDANLFVYPVPRFDDALTENVHVSYPITLNGSTVDTPIHKIPNLLLAKWNERHMLRVFFPKKCPPGQPPQELTLEERAQFYEEGLLPAIQSINEQIATEWPAKYSNELFRARKSTGAFAFTTKIVNHFDNQDFGRALRAKLLEANVTWANDFFFYYQVRGTKHGTTHALEPEAAEAALKDFIRDCALDFDSITEAQLKFWWIDVGVEFSSDFEDCLQWRTDSHFHIIQHALEINEPNAVRITTPGSSKYERDVVAHLTGVSGCRISPGERAKGPFDVVYIQLYPTDKAVTYAPHGQHKGKTLEGKDAIGPTSPPSFCAGLHDLYADAASHNTSKARIELRVPFAHALAVMLDFPDPLIRQSLLAFPPNIWWGFRSLTLEGATRLLMAQQRGEPDQRAHRDAILLTAGLVWFINCLHSRPEEGKACRDLVNAILPHTESDTEVSYQWPHRANEHEDHYYHYPTRAHVARGAIFLRPISYPPNIFVPRLGYGMEVEDETLEYFFGMNIDSLNYKINPTGVAPAGTALTIGRSNNKFRRTPQFVPLTDDPQPPLFNLGFRGFTLPPPERPGPSADPPKSIDETLTDIYQQFVVDLIQKSPNPRGTQNRSYCSIPTDDRASLSDAVFVNETLSDMWLACYYKPAQQSMWTTVFDHLWPTKNHRIPAKSQNYTQSRYYTDWRKLCAGLDDRMVDGLRAQLKVKIDTYYWIPHAGQDKIWYTKKEPGFIRLGALMDPSHPERRAAPRILVREYSPPKWNYDVDSDAESN